MTKLLEKAVKRVSRLSSTEQNVIAEIIIEEIEDEKKWEEKFRKSQYELSKLADEAVNEFKEGRTKSL